jgi:structural maintenance of chromosome 2
VNKKVLAMFDKAESEYQELVSKRSIVEKDKEKIQQVIGELDEKKAQALHLTWEKVNKDFGSIFSMLLPGTMAKLEPPEGGSVLDGLEVRSITRGSSRWGSHPPRVGMQVTHAVILGVS